MGNFHPPMSVVHRASCVMCRLSCLVHRQKFDFSDIVSETDRSGVYIFGMEHFIIDFYQF